MPQQEPGVFEKSEIKFYIPAVVPGLRFFSRYNAFRLTLYVAPATNLVPDTALR